jgi:protease IV
MMRWLWLVLFSPFWLPRWALGRARWKLRKQTTLQVVLRGSMPDLSSRAGLLGLLRPPGGPDLLSLLEALGAAAGDEKLKTVLVRIEELHCGLGRAEELRAALARLVSAGKQVIVFADELGLGAYWLALGASSVRLSPTGSFNVSGVAMDFTLLEGLLRKVGVRAQLLARGKYKSAREMFTEQALSAPNREMLTSLVDDLSSQLIALTSAARGQSLESAAAHIHGGPFRAEEARERGLIDATQYWDELWREVGGESSQVQSLAAYRKALARRRSPTHRVTQVGLLRITGNLRHGHDRQGADGPRATGHRSVERALRGLVRSPLTRAIVVRVDSPGGSALASDLMWRALTLAAQKKPVFVSMANIAASGGYYASGLKGVQVWASPTTLTGSIGVVGGKFEGSELLAKLGVQQASVTSGPHANFYSPGRPWGAEELDKMERDLDALYRDFVSKMADARGLSYEALHQVAQGRVWTGRQAQDNALVDHLGGLHEVSIAVRERLGLEAGAPLGWSAPSSPRGFAARRERDAEALLRGVEAALGPLPELPEALARAVDLRGERLFLLGPLELRVRS